MTAPGTPPVLRVDHVSAGYGSGSRSARVLRDVSLTLSPGDALAIVGRNGAGKSTLLKLLFGLVKPDRGEIRRNGRIEAIIELGTGFNPLLSGRENIAVGAALHGFSRAESRRLSEIKGRALWQSALERCTRSLLPHAREMRLRTSSVWNWS